MGDDTLYGVGRVCVDLLPEKAEGIIILTRKLRLSLLLATVLFASGAMVAGETFAAAADWFNEDWHYRKMITVVGPVINGPHTDFPMLIDIASDANLAANVAQADGGDIIFTDAPTSGPITRLPHEKVSYNNTTGALLAWVNVNSINNSTVIYMYYGNSTGGLTYGLSETEKEAVWTNNYVGVWHLDETSGTHYDSTSNDYDSSSINVTAQGQTVTAKIGGADEFTADQQVSIPDPGVNSPLDLIGSGPITFSGWGYPRSDGETFGYSSIFFKGSGITDLATQYHWSFEGNNCGAGRMQGSRAGRWGGACTSVVTYNDWTYMVYVYDNSNSPAIRRNYLNGQPDTTNTGDLFANDTSTPLKIGERATFSWDGYLDEVRIQSTNRSAGWIETEYNNQNNPSSFLTFSEQVSIPTMTEWGMIIFMVLAGFLSIYYLRRRRLL